MASNYWIKLYHEILQDPKMGRLPDHLWRRTIELFLTAGEHSNKLDREETGSLPPICDMAWTLHKSEAELTQELEELAKVGIVTLTDSGWIVTNFAKRQEAVGDAERMRRHRERKRQNPNPPSPPAEPKELPDPPYQPDPPESSSPSENGTCNSGGYAKVTNTDTKRNTESRVKSQILDEDEESRLPDVYTHDAKWQVVFNLYCNNIHASEAPITIQEMQQPEYLGLPEIWWAEAIKIACDNNSRRWSYIRGILGRSAKAGISPLVLGPPAQYKNGATHDNYRQNSRNSSYKNNQRRQPDPFHDPEQSPPWDPYAATNPPPRGSPDKLP